MLATREHDPPPPEPRPIRWDAEMIVGTVALGLFFAAWVACVIIVAIR